MIGKVVENSMNFGGLVDYLKREMKHATIIAHAGVCIVNRDAIVDSFRMQVEETCSTIAKLVGHIALSWKAEDASRLTDDFMAKVAQEYLNMMDIRNTQFIIARHFDTNHPHCHILYNRVDNDGRTISDSNIRRRNVAVCKKLNQKYGFTLGKKGDRRHQNPDKLKGKALAKYQMCAKVLAARQQSRSWNEFRSNLEKVGIKILFRYGKDAGIKGIIFADDERSFGGSKLDASLSLKELDKAFGGLFQSIDYGATAPEQSAKVQIMQSATAENVQPKYHLTEATPVESLPSAEPGNSDNNGGSDWLAIAFDVAMEIDACAYQLDEIKRIREENNSNRISMSSLDFWSIIYLLITLAMTVALTIAANAMILHSEPLTKMLWYISALIALPAIAVIIFRIKKNGNR